MSNKYFYTVLFLIATLIILWCNRACATSIPDPFLTPGETRSVTMKILCTTSTSLVRNVPASVRKQVYASYGMPHGNHTGYCAVMGGCELDHDISLELGGSNGIKNLFPMPYSGSCNARQKDALENKLHFLVCKGTITLQQAQSVIRGDWRPAYKKYINAKGCM